MFPSNFVSVLEESDAEPAENNNDANLAMNNNGINGKTRAAVETAPQLPPKPIRETARVLYPYTPQYPDELELKDGDLIHVLSKDSEEKGWWRGEVNNKVNITS